MANKGLYKYTTQEALNHHLGKVITVNPTIADIGSPTQFSSGEPFLNSVEIPNAVQVPGGTSRLVALAFWNKDNEDMKHDILFHENSGEVLGTVNPGSGSLDISDTNFEALGYTGFIDFSAGDQEQLSSLSYGFATPTVLSPVMLLQAASGSTSTYFSVVMRDNPTLASTTDCFWVFHIEYK